MQPVVLRFRRGSSNRCSAAPMLPALLRAACRGQAACSPAPALSRYRAVGAVWGAATRATPPLGAAGGITPVRGFAFETKAEEEAAEEATRMTRDFAIIAHVDHGKTTMLDQLMRECQVAMTSERMMDSNDLEKERGITIQSKYTSFKWGGHTLNAVDTPGHADFGGEVERVLSMVDGAVLLVDALEGPLAQTKFVVSKALARGLQPLLVLNKVDRPAVTKERCDEVEGELFELFAGLGASDAQLDFRTIYASAREGVAAATWERAQELLAAKAKGEKLQNGMADLLDAITEVIEPPKGSNTEPFRMLVTMIERDAFMGRLVTGRVFSGHLKVGDRCHALMCLGAGKREDGRITKIFTRQGMTKVAIDVAKTGDIVSVAGFTHCTVTDTVAALEVTENLPSQPIDPPTVKMSFGVNDSPLAGKHGSQLTGSKLGERLKTEVESNVSIVLSDGAEGGQRAGEVYEVQGRGELQMGVLIETMRREGFEMSISPPQVMFQEDAEGRKLEPMEEVMIQADECHVGAIIEALTLRKGEMTDMVPAAGEGGRTKLTFDCPSRGLIGYNSVFANSTSGSGIITRSFKGYEPHKGPMDQTKKGSLIAMAQGPCTGYSLMALEPRGVLFVEHGTEVYAGMIVGEHSKGEDMEVNPTKEKRLNNIRNKGSEEQIKLIPPRKMSLEEAIGWVAADEIIEVTPKVVRLRKRVLDSSLRKREKK